MEEKASEDLKAFDSTDLKREISSEVLPKEIDSSSSSHTAADDPDGNPEVVGESPKDEERKYLTGIKLFMVISAVTLVCFLVLLDTSIIVTVSLSASFAINTSDASQAIPVITTHFHSLEDLGWYGSSYQIARYSLNRVDQMIPTNSTISACLQPLTGRIYTNFRTKVSLPQTLLKWIGI